MQKKTIKSRRIGVALLGTAILFGTTITAADPASGAEQEPPNTVAIHSDVTPEVKYLVLQLEPKPTPAPTPPPPTLGEQLLAVALNYEGVPYVPYSANPSGFDCSGLISFSLSQLGITVPHGADRIAESGTRISEDEARPGDLVWYPGQHIEIWVKPGVMFGASREGTLVSYHNIWGSPVFIRL